MAKAKDKGIELDEGKSILGAGNQKQVERLLKKAADQATKAAKHRWKRSRGNPFSNHAHARMGGIERALTNALTGALTFHSNNSGQRPSIRMTAPDTGGRPFHFDHTAVSSQTIKLKPGETAKAVRKSGKFEARPKRHTSSCGAHMAYLERDGAAERIEVDLEAAANLRAEIEGMGRELKPGAMQAYVEDPSKAEDLKRATEGKPPTALVFSYGTPDMGDTLEERMAFWDLAEAHARGESGTIQHRLIMELPHEATPEDRLAIMKAFTTKFDEDKIPYHVVLHAPTSKNDDRNYHAHVVMLNRPAVMIDWPLGGKVKIGPEGPLRKTWDFAAKSFLPDDFRVTKWRYPERQTILPEYRATFVKDQRKRFSDIVNERMAAVGNPVRYDHRSYKAMGLEVDAMRSISRIIKDKAKTGDRIVLDYAQTKRDVEAEIQRLARERAPDFAEVSAIRAAVRKGDRELRTLEKEAGFLRKKPILRRGAHAVKTFVKRKALDYARTRALHVERSIEAAQEMRSIERVVEATRPEVTATLRSRLAGSMVKARSSKNKKEVARLAAEIKSVPTTALAQILHDTAKSELASLEKRHEAHASMRLSRVGKALRDWREAASGYLRPRDGGRRNHGRADRGGRTAEEPRAADAEAVGEAEGAPDVGVLRGHRRRHLQDAVPEVHVGRHQALRAVHPRQRRPQRPRQDADGPRQQADRGGQAEPGQGRGIDHVLSRREAGPAARRAVGAAKYAQRRSRRPRRTHLQARGRHAAAPARRGQAPSQRPGAIAARIGAAGADRRQATDPGGRSRAGRPRSNLPAARGRAGRSARESEAQAPREEEAAAEGHPGPARTRAVITAFISTLSR